MEVGEAGRVVAGAAEEAGVVGAVETFFEAVACS